MWVLSRQLSADCEKCFALCCVALPFAKSADFAMDKANGIPCPNLLSNHHCSIHDKLRKKGFRGCATYECFGAGQKVSQTIYNGKDWRENPELAREMFMMFPIVQQLHEMLYYLNEALNLKGAEAIHNELIAMIKETENLTYLSPKSILQLDVSEHRRSINELLLSTSERVRANFLTKKGNRNIGARSDLIGAKLKGINLQGENLRGVLFIAADLRQANLRGTDLIGADFRDANVSGADFSESIFLTQAQVNSANGDFHTKLPSHLSIPLHWK